MTIISVKAGDLQKRCIAPQVIRDFIGAGLLYEDAKYHNCVFVGRNGAGKPVFAAKRGTYDLNGAAFRGGVPGSDKEVAFRLPCDSRQLRVFVFEAPIDLMSYCTLHRSVKSNAVALCCLYDGPLDTYLRENPHLRRIDLCLDADEPGREAVERMKDKYTQKGYSVTVHTPARGKDWKAAADAGYPYGFGDNLTVFTGTADAAQHAVDNWINSPGHFETMIDPRCDCIGVGVTQYDGITYCYMFVGIPNSVNFYA